MLAEVRAPHEAREERYDMAETFGIANIPDRRVEMYLVATNWWLEEGARPLPGEESQTTVFVVDFSDGCAYFGYTRESVAGRVASLMSDLGWGGSEFVREHAGTVAYVVRCVASNLDERGASELRNLLVAQAPGDVSRRNGTTVTTSDCWPREGGTEADVLSLSEWIKTREMPAGTAVSE